MPSPGDPINLQPNLATLAQLVTKTNRQQTLLQPEYWTILDRRTGPDPRSDPNALQGFSYKRGVFWKAHPRIIQSGDRQKGDDGGTFSYGAESADCLQRRNRPRRAWKYCFSSDKWFEGFAQVLRREARADDIECRD